MAVLQSSGRVTLEEIAQDAGVSRATVSLVVRDSPLIDDETRRRVLDSIDRLGYVYNQAAAYLRSRRSRAVGLIVTDITNPFFSQMALGCEAALGTSAYTLLLANNADDVVHQARLIHTMVARDVDGLLLCPARGTSPAHLELLHQYELPYVLIARYLPNLGANYVGADNETGSYLATRHLLDRGHSRIAFVGGSDASSARRDRLVGYRRALAEGGLQIERPLLVSTPVSRAGGFSGIEVLLALPDPPTAAVCYNDVVAFGVMMGLEAAGMEAGQAFGVVGFDDIEEAALWHPALTTVSIPSGRVGQAAAQLILSHIASAEEPPQQVVLEPRLVVRESS